MIYPVITLIKYLFGSRDSATALLSNITPKRMIGFHFVNLIISLSLVFILAVTMSKLIIDGEMYSIVSQFVKINTMTVFQSFLPMTILSYILWVIFLIALTLFYFFIAKLFKSKVNLKDTIYASQFFGLLHPLSHIYLLTLITVNNPNLMLLIIVLFSVLAITLFFTINKQYAQIYGITFITMIFINLILIGIAAIFLSLLLQGGLGKI